MDEFKRGKLAAMEDLMNWLVFEANAENEGALGHMMSTLQIARHHATKLGAVRLRLVAVEEKGNDG